VGLQNFTPPIHISEPDFLGLIDPDLLPEDRKLGPEEFEAVMRRQLQTFSQARLANVPAVRTAGDTDFLLFNTLKMVLLQVLPMTSTPGKNQDHLKQQNLPGRQQGLAGSLSDDPTVSDVKAVRNAPLKDAEVGADSKGVKKDGSSRCCCCCCCCYVNGSGGKDGNEARGYSSSRRAQRRLLELEEGAMSELIQVIAGPVRDRLLRDVLDPLGREVARLRAGRGLITGDISCESDPSASAPVSAGHILNNDLVLLKGREQPTDHQKAFEKQGQQGGRAWGAAGGGGGAWLFPKAVKREKPRSAQLHHRSEQLRSANRRETTHQPWDHRASPLWNMIVDEKTQVKAAAAETTAFRVERSSSGAAYSLPPSSLSDVRQRHLSARRPQQQPSSSARPGPRDDSLFPVSSHPQLHGGESVSPSGWGVRPSSAHNPGRALRHSMELERASEGRGRIDMGCDGGGVRTADSAAGGDMEEQLHPSGSPPGMMMHMRFSIAQ
jgi:hypothetical protein